MWVIKRQKVFSISVKIVLELHMWRLIGSSAFVVCFIITKSLASLHFDACFTFSFISSFFSLTPSSIVPLVSTLRRSHLVIFTSGATSAFCFTLVSTRRGISSWSAGLTFEPFCLPVDTENAPPHEKGRTFNPQFFVWTRPMCNYAGSFVLVTWVVSRCALKLIIDVGAHRLGAWQGLLTWESEMNKKTNEPMPGVFVCVCVLHMFMWMRFFLDATESTCKKKKSLRIQFHSVSSMSSFPNLSSLHLVPALAFSFSAVSVSTGLLARCVCHVQRERLRGQEAPSSGILNFSHPNKRLVLSEKHCGYSVSVSPKLL